MLPYTRLVNLTSDNTLARCLSPPAVFCSITTLQFLKPHLSLPPTCIHTLHQPTPTIAANKTASSHPAPTHPSLSSPPRPACPPPAMSAADVKPWQMPHDLFELSPTSATYPAPEAEAHAQSLQREAGQCGVVWFHNFGSSCDLRSHLHRRGLDTSIDPVDFQRRGGILIGRRISSRNKPEPRVEDASNRAVLFARSASTASADASDRRRWFGRRRRSSSSANRKIDEGSLSFCFSSPFR